MLIRFVVQRGSETFVFWATPGGCVEDGETEAETARRELIEELHLDIPLTGPVHTAVDRFEHEGALVANTDVFFVGRCHRGAPRLDALTATERAAMQEIRWWSAEGIERTTETIFPVDLATVIRAVV